MTTSRWIVLLSGAAAAGAVAWFAKFAAALASDGAETVAVATFYLSGLGLLALGTAGIVLRLLVRAPFAVRLVAALLSPALFFAVFLFLDETLVPLAQSSVADWRSNEAGVLATAFIWLVAALWAIRSAIRRTPRSERAIDGGGGREIG